MVMNTIDDSVICKNSQLLSSKQQYVYNTLKTSHIGFYIYTIQCPKKRIPILK